MPVFTGWHVIFCESGMVNTALLLQIRDHLLRMRHTVSVAESVTGGMLQSALAGTPDAMRFFQGGITAYNIGQKCRHLHIEPVHAQESNCVSARVAEEMATGVCAMFRSEWGIGVTGYATPVPESDNQTFAWFAIAYEGKILETVRLNAPAGDPDALREWYTEKSLDAFAAHLPRM